MVGYCNLEVTKKEAWHKWLTLKISIFKSHEGI